MFKNIKRKKYLKNLGSRMTSEWTDLNKKIADAAEYDIRCVECPKYSRTFNKCLVPFGSKLRSCICASTEYHLRDATGKSVLEIGCGESSFAKQCVDAVGGKWIGIDPRPGKKGIRSTRSVGAQVAYLPFPEKSFDVVAGTQTLEHWEDPLSPVRDCSYLSAMDEIWRILKPGGYFYLDAPMHLHGAPEFILGDLVKIRTIFANNPWQNMKILSWRKEYGPLPPAMPKKDEVKRWSGSIDHDQIDKIKNSPMFILAISAYKL